VYGDVPPPGVAVALPVLPPLHFTFVILPVETVKTAGCVIVALAVDTQPLASCTVTV